MLEQKKVSNVTRISLLHWLGFVVLAVSGSLVQAQQTGDLHKAYFFAATKEEMPYRVYVPTTWDGHESLPIILMLHGAGADENTYFDIAEGLLGKLAEEHGYIVVSPLGHTPLGAYGNLYACRLFLVRQL